MQEHPIPQDITGYRFHIIGSMTLKQFGELLAGVIVGLIFYKTNLFLPIKWFFVILSVGLGAGAAFLPIEERPLDHWIVTFIKILYKPTQFFWRKTARVPDPFLFEPHQVSSQNQEVEIDVGPIRRDRIKEYLRSVNSQFQSAEDNDQQARIQQIVKTFQTEPAIIDKAPKKVVEKPDLSVRVRKMRSDPATVLPQEVTVYASNKNGVDQPVEMDGQVRDFSQTKKSILSTEQVAQQISIPKTQLVSSDAIAADEEDASLNTEALEPNQRAYIAQSKSEEKQDLAGAANYNTDLPFPSVPDVPNKLVGMVISTEGNILSDVIVEIHDQDSIERAVKTNALGQFFITTPLDDGEFVLKAEKDGFTFEDQKIVLKGEVVPPVEVRSL